MDGDEGRECRAGAGERLEDKNRVEPAQPRAADILVDIDAAEAERAGLADDVGREVTLAIPVQRIGRDPFRREGLGHLADRALILVEFELHGLLGYGVHNGLPSASSSPAAGV